VVLSSVYSVFSQWPQWFNPAGLAKFERMREEGYLDLVYENERVRIYLVRNSSTPLVCVRRST